VAVGVTAQPDSSWVPQQVRNATMELNDRQVSTRFLLRDHDAKFTRAFYEVFRTEGAEVIRTPIRAMTASPGPPLASDHPRTRTIQGQTLNAVVLGLTTMPSG
jgi:hypothetical protein